MFSQYQWLTNLPSIKTQCSSNPNLRPTFTQLKPNVLPILKYYASRQIIAWHWHFLRILSASVKCHYCKVKVILYRMSWKLPIYTAISKSQCSRLRKCCRQVEAEVISNSRNKIESYTSLTKYQHSEEVYVLAKFSFPGCKSVAASSFYWPALLCWAMLPRQARGAYKKELTKSTVQLILSLSR